MDMNLNINTDKIVEDDDVEDFTTGYDVKDPAGQYSLYVRVVENKRYANCFLTGTITNETVDSLIEFIVEQNFVSDKLKVINIFIDSTGGDLHPAFKFIDTVQMSLVPIRTIGWGVVGSSALMIFMAGYERLISKFTSVLSHQATLQLTDFNAKVNDFAAQQKEFNNIMSNVFTHYRTVTKHDDEFIRNNMVTNVDEYLTAKETVDFGLATGILQDKGDFSFLTSP